VIQTLLDWGQSLPEASLYGFIFLWLFVESTGFPLSDEPLLLLSGTLIAERRLSALLVLGVALAGKVLASCLAYWLGQRIPLERLARPVHPPVTRWQQALFALRPKRTAVQAVQERFQRQGAWGVFLGRLVPVVRSFISYPAGASRMSFATFLLSTTAGSALWIIGWTLLGALLGHAALRVLARWNHLSGVVLGVFLLVLGGLWLWAHRRRARGSEMPCTSTGDEAQDTEPSPRP
jgi:membrane protein DedA with SNARE-associated domain